MVILCYTTLSGQKLIPPPGENSARTPPAKNSKTKTKVIPQQPAEDEKEVTKVTAQKPAQTKEYLFNSGSAGLGIGILYGYVRFGAGLRFYGLPVEYAIRPRMTVIFGTNAFIDVNSRFVTDEGAFSHKYNEAHYGVTVSMGSRFLFGKAQRHGFDVDVCIIAYSTVYNRIDELSTVSKGGIPVMDVDEKPFRLKLSMGYRSAF